MKQFIYTFLLIAMTLMTGCIRVSPKEVTIRVHELGDNAGEIEIFSIPGRYGPAGFEATDYSFPTVEQNYRWTEDASDDYGSENDEAIQLQIESNNCKLDLGVRFYVDNQNIPGLKTLVTKYPTNLDGIVDGLLYDVARGAIKEAVQGMSLDDVMNNLSSIIRGPVADSVAIRAEVYGIHVVEVYDISGLNPPKSVMQRKIQTQEANEEILKAQKHREAQAIQNETRLDKVRSDSTATIIQAQAEAESNKIRNTFAPNDRVLEQMKIEKWNGVEAPGSDVILMQKQQ